MPISRKKSCAQCRDAKARCSLALPRCARCNERGLLCEYTGFIARPAPYPYSKTPSLPNISELDVAAFSAAGASEFLELEHILGDGLDAEQADVTFGSQGLESETSSTFTPPLSSTGCTLSTYIFDMPTLGTGAPPPTLNAATPTPSPAATVVASVPTPTQQSTNDDRQVLKFSAGTTLRKRQSTSIRACGAGNIMFGQIESYPRMLTQGLTLPPFIHSRCFQDEGASFDCYEKRFHRCLPELLSICASLVHLFYTRTEANKAFVWKTIYAEQARIAREMPNYDAPTLLDALQTMCIYMILQAQDQESLERNDPKPMVALLGDISIRLHDKCGYGERKDSFENPLSRREWLFEESVRRTYALLLLVEVLLEVMIGRVEGPCVGCHAIPLPCGRDLWEVESTPEWSRRYKESLRRRKLPRSLTVGDIVCTQGGSSSRSSDGAQEEAVLTDVASWCQGVDQYGMLFWTAIMMKET